MIQTNWGQTEDVCPARHRSLYLNVLCVGCTCRYFLTASSWSFNTHHWDTLRALAGHAQRDVSIPTEITAYSQAARQSRCCKTCLTSPPSLHSLQNNTYAVCTSVTHPFCLLLHFCVWFDIFAFCLSVCVFAISALYQWLEADRQGRDPEAVAAGKRHH